MSNARNSVEWPLSVSLEESKEFDTKEITGAKNKTKRAAKRGSED